MALSLPGSDQSFCQWNGNGGRHCAPGGSHLSFTSGTAPSDFTVKQQAPEL
jgi:hypothetical protein